MKAKTSIVKSWGVFALEINAVAFVVLSLASILGGAILVGALLVCHLFLGELGESQAEILTSLLRYLLLIMVIQGGWLMTLLAISASQKLDEDGKRIEQLLAAIKAEGQASRSPLLCQECSYLSRDPAARLVLAHPCAVHPSGPPDPDYCLDYTRR